MVITRPTREQARKLIVEQGSLHTLVVRFITRANVERRMVCRYFGHTSAKPHLVCVWDMEKGAVRCINLQTVNSIVVCDSGVPHPLKSRSRNGRIRPIPASSPASHVEQLVAKYGSARQAIHALMY